MFDNYIWDFDGTLYDSYPIMLDNFMKTLASYEITATPSEIYQTLKQDSSKKVAEIYQLNFDEFTKRFKAFEAEDKRQPVSFAGVKEILTGVTVKNGKNFILTHRDVASTQSLLVNEGLEKYVVEIIGPENNFPRKPDPTALLYLVEKYSLNPKKTVMIGDRPMDILAGKGAKVATAFFDIDDFSVNATADFHVTSMAEMKTQIL